MALFLKKQNLDPDLLDLASRKGRRRRQRLPHVGLEMRRGIPEVERTKVRSRSLLGQA